MQECLPEAQLASLVEALPLDPEALSPPTSEGVYRLQELVNAPLPFTVVEPEEEGQRPYIRPWRVLDEDGQPRMLSREEAAVAAVESVHDRMAQITEAMYGAGLTNFVPFGLLYERLTLANKVAMEKGMAGEADGIQDVVLNGVVVAKFADKFFNTLDTIVEEMKTEPKLAFDEPQKAHIHELRVARYKRLGLVDWSERPTPDELEPIPLKESWRQLSDIQEKMGKKLEELPVWLLGSLGVNAHINADFVEALIEAGANNEYADEFAVVQNMLDKIGRVVLHEFGNFPGERIDNAINRLTLFLVAGWRKKVFAGLGRFTNGEATQDQLRDEADKRAVKIGRRFMMIAKIPPIYVKTGGEIGAMHKNIRAVEAEAA